MQCVLLSYASILRATYIVNIICGEGIGFLFSAIVTMVLDIWMELVPPREGGEATVDRYITLHAVVFILAVMCILVALACVPFIHSGATYQSAASYVAHSYLDYQNDMRERLDSLKHIAEVPRPTLQRALLFSSVQIPYRRILSRVWKDGLLLFLVSVITSSILPGVVVAMPSRMGLSQGTLFRLLTCSYTAGDCVGRFLPLSETLRTLPSDKDLSFWIAARLCFLPIAILCAARPLPVLDPLMALFLFLLGTSSGFCNTLLLLKVQRRVRPRFFRGVGLVMGLLFSASGMLTGQLMGLCSYLALT